MRSTQEHAAAVAAVLPSPRVVTRPLSKATGLVLAEDVVAAHPSPRFDNSQMDGYAIGSLGGGEFTVGTTVAAGVDPDTVCPSGVCDLALPIMTGAKLPAGTTAIVPVEACQPATFPEPGETVTIPAVVGGQFIRRAGSDVEAGEVLITAGTRLNPAAVAVLAGQGLTEVVVESERRIVICTGGAEVGTPGVASIPDSNAPMLAAAARVYGIEVAGFIHTNDSPKRLREELEYAVSEYQPAAIVTSGGISHGKFEVVRQVLEEHGWFGHVAQQPGGPQGLSHIAGVPVICLPGNPVSSLVSFRLFVAPALGSVPASFQAALTAPATGLKGKDQYLRGTVSMHAERAEATPVGGSGSHLIAQAIPANCLIRIPADAELDAGDLVHVYPLEAQ